MLGDNVAIDSEKSGYKSIILPFTSVMNEKTLAKINGFAKSGGLVISSGEFAPTDENGEKSETYDKLLNELRSSINFVVFKKHREDEIVGLLVDKLGLKPVSGDNGGVLLLKRKDGYAEIDFFVNVTDEGKRFVVKRKGFSGAEILNAENGDIIPARFSAADGGVSVEINIPANDSVIVAFTNDGVKSSAKEEEKIIQDITDGWTVEKNGKTVKRADFFAAGKENFSGEVAFVKKTAIEKPEGRLCLRLEKVDTYASVKVNGKFAGARLWSPYVFDISDYVLSGENEIELTIGSTEENVMTESNKNYGVFGRISLTEIKNNG